MMQYDSHHFGTFRTVCLLSSLVLGACGESAPRSAQRLDSETATIGVSATGLSSPTDAAHAGSNWYVADASEDAIIVLDDAGAQLRRIGSRGLGPGEVRTPNAVAVRNDRVLLADIGNRRVSEFDTAGAFVRTIPSDGCQGTAVALRIVARGAMLLRRCLEQYGVESLRLEIEDEVEFKVSEIKYTIRSPGEGRASITFPLFDATDSRVVIGDGQTGCVMYYEISTGKSTPETCFDGLPSLAIPDSVRTRMLQRAGGRMDIPKLLPKLLAIALHDSGTALLVPVDHVRSRWVMMDSVRQGVTSQGRPLTDPLTRRSFVSDQRILVIQEGETGLIAESVPLVR